MDLTIDIADECKDIIIAEQEHFVIEYYDHNNVDVVDASLIVESQAVIKANYTLSNDYVVSFRKGVGTDGHVFHRLEIEDACGETLHAQKEKRLENIIPKGYNTLTEAILVRTFSILESL